MVVIQSILFSAFIAVTVPFLFVLSSTDAAMELGKVQCIVIVNFTETFHDAHRTCWEQHKKENKDNDKPKKDHKHRLWNATVEEFEWDDHCQSHCVYKTAGIVKKTYFEIYRFRIFFC